MDEWMGIYIYDELEFRISELGGWVSELSIWVGV